MKKYLYSTLVAAAAMAVPAWATDYTFGANNTTSTASDLTAGGDGSVSSPYYFTECGSNNRVSITISGDNSIFTASGTTVYLATDELSFGSAGVNSFFASSVTAECDIVIGAAGVYLTNGTSGNVHTFSGKISGEGDWTVAYYASGTGSGVTQHYVFTGDLSEWTGNFTITTPEADDYVYYGNGGTAATNTNISGNGGSISVDYGTVQYNYSGYAGDTATSLTVTNSSIEGHKVTFTGSVNYEVSSTITGWDNNSGTSSSGSTLTISNTGTTTFSGSVSNFDIVTVGANSTLAIAQGGSLDLSSTTVNIGSTIQNSGTVTIDTSTSFVLDDSMAYTGDWTSSTGATYTLITGSSGTIYIGTDELTSENVSSLTISNVSSSVTITDATFSFVDGTLSVTVKGNTAPLGSTASNPYTGAITDFDLSTWAAGSTVYIDGVTSGYWVNANMTVVANINIGSGGLVLTDAYSDNVYTFAGAITGSGNWTFNGPSNSSPTQHYIFTGDVSGYSGNFSMTAGGTAKSEGYLEFGNGGQAATNTNVSGTGSITTSTNFAVIYNYGSLADDGETAITIGNTSITTADLQFAGSVSYIVSSDLKGTGSSATMTISNTGTTTISGSISGFASVIVAEGSTLAFDGAVSIGSAITNSGTVSLNSSVTFVLDNMTFSGDWDSTEGATYTLISGGTIQLGSETLSSGTVDSLDISNVSSTLSTITSATFNYDGSSLTLTVTGTYVAIVDGVNGTGTADSPYFTHGTATNVGVFTEKGTTVYLATDTYSFGDANSNTYWDGDGEVACNIVIGKAGIYITNGGSGQVHTFSGKISGEGSWTVTTGSVTQAYVFTGDLSEWSGDFIIDTSNSADYVYFGNGGTAATNTAISGTGAVAVDHGEVRYDYSGYANGGTVLTVANTSIEGHKVTFTGSVDYNVSADLRGWDGSSTSTGGGATTTGSTLTISTAGTVTVSGKVSGFDSIVVSENSGLTVASGASVTLKSGSTLSVADGGTLTLNTAITADGATVSFSENASLVLTDAFLASAIESASVGPISTFDANEAVTITIITASAINYNGDELSDASSFASAVISYDTDNYLLENWTYSEGVLSASVTYLPEPELFSIFFGLGAIGLVATRRRRRA